MGSKLLAASTQPSLAAAASGPRNPRLAPGVPEPTASKLAGSEAPALDSADEPPPAAAPQRPGFKALYEAEFDFVWRSLLLLGVKKNVVEDAAQEVFSVVSRQLHRFEGRSTLRTWLFAIVQRVASNQRRTVRRKQRALEPLDDDGPECLLPTPHARAEAAESIDIVQRFCDSLEPDRRALFVLALLEELPAPEVAQALGIPINTVYSRLRHLREGLRRLLDGVPGESEVKRG
jgi:RNA polymerase sigma-70 factor, ECF subfamily